MKRIFVAGLPFALSEWELTVPFSRWGTVASCSIRRDNETGHSRGFGFVEMPNALEAAVAIGKVDGTVVGGRVIVVSEERVLDSAVRLAELATQLRAAEHVPLSDRALLQAARAVRVESDLLARVAADPISLWSISPRQFEELVCEILGGIGFDEVHLTPESKDNGVDIYAVRSGSNGSSLFVVECKRWVPPHHVGLSVVQRLYGVMHWQGAAGGIVATTSRFTQPAQEWQAGVDDELALRDLDGVLMWMRACVDQPGAV